MAKRKVIIRAGGNSNIGLGHIYRGIALAEMLKDEYDLLFVVKPDSTIEPIKDAGFMFKYLPDNLTYLEEPEWFHNIFGKEIIIICDGYEFKSEYQKRIKQQGFKLVYVDDLAQWHMYADVVINHSPGIERNDYSIEQYTKLALGLDYAMLRPAFLKAAKQKRKISKIDTAFVCFGGSDYYDLTYNVTRVLMQVNQIKHINIVFGSAYKHKEIFNIKNDNNRVNFYINLSEGELINVMFSSNLAIVPSSTILFETISVKMPIISGFYADNQKYIYKELKKLGVFEGVDKLTTFQSNLLKKSYLIIANIKA